MPGGFVVEGGPVTGGYHGRVTAFVVLSCIVAGSRGILFGYDLGISGGLTFMDSFLKQFFPDVYEKKRADSKMSNYCKFDSQLLMVFTSSIYIAGLIAAFCASKVTRTLGRRASMLIGGSVFIIGSALGGAAVNVYMLILGRILLGVGLGFTNQSIPLYLSEMAPPQYRGAISNGFELSISLGILFANVLNYFVQKTHSGWGWRILLSLAALPASFLTIGAIFLPESPSFTIQKGNIEEASIILQKLRGTPNVQKELDDLIAASNISHTIKNPFRNILRRKYRPQLVMAIVIPLFNQLSGINVINFYAPVMFRTIGFNESSALLLAAVTRLFAMAANIIAMVMVDRFGRRFLFIVGGIQMILSQITIGGILFSQLKDHGSMEKAYAYLVLIIICVFVTGFAWSWGPLTYLVPNEVSTLEIRSAAQSIVVAVLFLAAFFIGQTFLGMLCQMKAGTFFFFTGMLFAMTAFVYFLLPETKKVPLEQMDQIWRRHPFWKKIVEEEETKYVGS